MQKKTLWAKCPNCYSQMFPKLNVVIKKNDEDHLARIQIFSPFFMYESVLLEYYDLKEEFCLESYSKNKPPLFWNVVWYSTVIKLPFYHFIPRQKYIPIHKASAVSNNELDQALLLIPKYETILKSKISVKPNDFRISQFELQL